MILLIANLLVKFFKFDSAKAKFYANIVVVFVAIILLILIFLGLRACFSKEAKIDQESINKINTANEKQRKEELQKVIQENADVIKTVDERTTITEANVEERDRQIQAKIEEADRKIAEARKGGKDVTQEELKCILIPENCQ